MSARQASMLLFLAAVWGASFLFIAIAVGDLGALGVAESRVLLGACGLVVYAAAVGRLPALRRLWRQYLLLGAVNAGLPFALIAAAETAIPASLAAIVNATAPLFSALVGALWVAQPLARRSWVGLALGLGGVALVVGLAPIALTGRTILAAGASLAAAAAYGVGGHYAKLRFSGESPLAVSIGQLVGAAAALAPVLAVLPPTHAPRAGPIAAVAALGLVCTGLAYLAYFRLIAELGATSAITVTYLVPVFGVLWAAIFRGDRITLGMLGGAVVVLAGVLLVTGTSLRRRSPRPAPAAPPAEARDPLPGPPSEAPQRAGP